MGRGRGPGGPGSEILGSRGSGSSGGFGVPGFRSSGVPRFRGPGVQGVPGSVGSGVPWSRGFGNSGVPGLRGSEIPEFGVPGFRDSGVPWFWGSGVPRFRGSGDPESGIRGLGSGVRPESGPEWHGLRHRFIITFPIELTISRPPKSASPIFSTSPMLSKTHRAKLNLMMLFFQKLATNRTNSQAYRFVLAPVKR